LIFITLFICLSAVLFAGGKREKRQNPQEELHYTKVQVSGRVRLVGSSPMSELVITGQEREWYVIREEQNKLYDLQHRTVTVECYENVMELRFANGLSAGERRTIKDIKIIAIE